MDLLNDFINQSTRLTAASAGSAIEPIFGGSPTAGIYSQPQVAPPQQFSEVVPPSTPIMSQRVMSQETLRKFSCCNPVGSLPSDYGPSKSCAKCHYFETSYDESYGRDRAGYCAKFDFPCSSGYTCSAFELYGSVKPDAGVMPNQAFSDSANELLNKLETKPTEVLTEPVVPVQPVVAPPVVPTPVAPAPAPATELPATTAVSLPSEPAPVVPAPVVINPQPLVFADPELYSEARDMTVTRFSNPDSAMALEYTRQKYVSKYRAKHGSVTKAFG